MVSITIDTKDSSVYMDRSLWCALADLSFLCFFHVRNVLLH